MHAALVLFAPDSTQRLVQQSRTIGLPPSQRCVALYPSGYPRRIPFPHAPSPQVGQPFGQLLFGCLTTELIWLLPRLDPMTFQGEACLGVCCMPCTQPHNLPWPLSGSEPMRLTDPCTIYRMLVGQGGCGTWRSECMNCQKNKYTSSRPVSVWSLEQLEVSLEVLTSHVQPKLRKGIELACCLELI